MDIREAQQAELLAAALEARRNAYCPYSGYAVGAALLTSNGNVHSGCNVENISYGLTICAERNAIAAAVECGMQPGELRTLSLVAGPVAPSPFIHGAPVPCGACLQVIAEFAARDCRIVCAAPGYDQPRTYSLAELLPHRFGKL